MTRLALALAATTILAGCAAAPVAPPPAPPAAAEAPPPPPPPAPKPQFGSYGFDTPGVDSAVSAGDNFYLHANGTWARTTPIPADKSNYGSFNLLDDLSKERTHDILEAAAKDPASKIGSAYASFLDQPAIEARGLAPIKPWLDQIKAVRTKAGLAPLYARANQIGIDTPFAIGVGQDDKSPEDYALGMAQAGLGMPDRDYYLSTDAKLVETRGKYLAHLTKVLTLAGEANAEARAKAILDLETRIARGHWNRIDSRDADKIYNKMTVAQLARRAPGFDFRTFFDRSETPVQTVVVAQPSAITAEAKIIASAPIGVLRDQLIVRSLDEYAPVLPKSFDDEKFAFYGTALSGTPEQEVRWKRAVAFTTAALSDEVSKVYVERFFPPETKAEADKLVKNVIAAMDRRIDKLDWMAPETKARAHAKLAAFTPKIGYPDRWRDFSSLEIRRDDPLGNAMRAAEWAHKFNVTKLGQPIYKWEWHMTPMDVNAYANFGMVEIVFPAAILQPPFFDPKADPAVNYGGIGAVIGHELSHHFDDQGAKYDATGKLVQWWSAADTAAFKARLDKLGKQYDAYEPLPGMHVKGALTMGENVADLAGLTVAHDAYLASLNGAPAPVIDGTTGDQRFYLGWAQVWRRNYREANLRQRLLTDPHSPSEQRANIVRNLDPWYPAFSVQPNQKLYLAPPERVRIW